MERETDALHERVRSTFARAAGPGVFHVDAGRGPDAVQSDAWGLLQEHFGETFPKRKG